MGPADWRGVCVEKSFAQLQAELERGLNLRNCKEDLKRCIFLRICRMRAVAAQGGVLRSWAGVYAGVHGKKEGEGNTCSPAEAVRRRGAGCTCSIKCPNEI